MERAGFLNQALSAGVLVLAAGLGLIAGGSGNFARAASVGSPPTPLSGPALTITDLEPFIQGLHLEPLYARSAEARPLRIAVLDNGFAGYKTVLGTLLPANTFYHPGPVDSPTPGDPHGTVMAEIIYRIMTDSGKYPGLTPELHLYDSRGYSNFKAAVDDCIARKVDLILYAQVWEYGGNDDGKGFINAVVDQATQAGITWVNASGDFGETTFQSMIMDARDSWVELPGPNESVIIRCERNPAGGCPLRLVLSWNDFKNNVNEGTDKDLDLILTDDTLNIVQSSQLVQKLRDDHQPGTTLYPREIIMTLLKPGTYYARVKDRSHNFGPRDRLRLTASGDFISMPQHTFGETLLPPADNPSVITVGASDTRRTGVAPELKKPEIEIPSRMHLQGGPTFYGTSSAAAVVVAGIGILKETDPEQLGSASNSTLIRAFLSLLHAPSQPVPAAPSTTPVTHSPAPSPAPFPVNQGGGDPRGTPESEGAALPLSLLNFWPTGPGCFIRVPSGSLPDYVQPWIQRGGVAVQTTAGIKLFFAGDPLLMTRDMHRISSDDILVCGPRGPSLYPRSVEHRLPDDFFELVELPVGQRICP